MKKKALISGLVGLVLMLLPALNAEESCSKNMICPCGPPAIISCIMSTSTPGHYVVCGYLGNDGIFCCEFNASGALVRDNHQTCSPCQELEEPEDPIVP